MTSQCFDGIDVELNTAAGSFLCGHSDSVSIQSSGRILIEIRSREGQYVSLNRTSEIALQTGSISQRFVLRNAIARFGDGRLCVLAEEIVLKEAA